MLQWILAKGGASITEADNYEETALLAATLAFHHLTAQWLLEHGGSDIAETNNEIQTVWTLLIEDILNADADADQGDEDDTVALTALLRVMVLRDAPPDGLKFLLSPEDARVVQEGARLRAGLPAYLARRRALLDEHCPLIAPLRALVSGYEEPTTTEELWATGLGAAPRRARRPLLSPLRRSARLRQRLE
jgi:hypothetical protein